MIRIITALGLVGTAMLSPPASAAAEAVEQAARQVSAAEVFQIASTAREKGDFKRAEAAYRALQADPDVEVRTEARFRLALMLANDMKRLTEAALQLRRILDDKPNAARVRFELARVLAQSGDLRAAERELRAAEAAGLPPDVERLVRFYAAALNARKAFGGSIEVALAPDSNINRATRSETLGTVIGDFSLDDQARAQSGIGVDLRGQIYWRKALEPGTEIIVRQSARASLYGHRDFNDISTSLQIGPQYASGTDTITLSAGPNSRWFGSSLYTIGYGGAATVQHRLGKRGQLRLDGSIQHQDNHRSAAQTADEFTLSAALDRAISARFGGGLSAYAFREKARDAGYSFISGGTSAYAFREIGHTTFVGTTGYSHLEADERLFLYPRRRREDRINASLAVTLRALHVGAFAPLVRVSWERNLSSIEIYDYSRTSAEIGVSSAF